MKLRNKSARQDQFKKGKMSFTGGIFQDPGKSPEMFYNSDEFRKMQNRKKGRRC